MREVYPTKYYRGEGFVERKFEINEEDLHEIIEDYLTRHVFPYFFSRTPSHC